MKWYVLTLSLLVGFVWSASAQQVDSRLIGEWETTDGPCNPCTMSIQENGGVKFYQAGSALEVIAAQVTPEPGVDIILPQGGKLDLSLTKSSKFLVGYYTSATQNLDSKQPVAFRHK